MPIVSNVIGGAKIIASAKIARRFQLTVVQATSSVETDAELQVNNLPHHVYYAIMTAGPAGTTFTPEFAVDNNAAGTPRYFPLLQPQLLVLGTPFFFAQRLAGNMISGIVTVPAGAVNATVQVILTSSM